MNPYEITYIVRPDLDDEQTRGAADAITRRFEAAGSEVIVTYPWHPPRRRLAYPIKDFGDGFYVTTVFNVDPTALPEIENWLKLNENVLRYLIVQATEGTLKQAEQRAQQPVASATPPSTEADAGEETESSPNAESTAIADQQPVRDEQPANEQQPVADEEPATEPVSASSEPTVQGDKPADEPVSATNERSVPDEETPTKDEQLPTATATPPAIPEETEAPVAAEPQAEPATSQAE